MGDSLDLPRNEALLESSDLMSNECAALFPLEWLNMLSSQLDQIAAGQVAFIVLCAVIEVAI